MKFASNVMNRVISIFIRYFFLVDALLINTYFMFDLKCLEGRVYFFIILFPFSGKLIYDSATECAEMQNINF